MKTLDDVLTVLGGMDIDPSELKLSGAAYDYLIEKAREIINAEEEEETQECED